MTEKERSKWNARIAKFDGWKKQPDFVNSDDEVFPYYMKMVDGREEYIHYHPNSYHESWKWMMPVLEKINRLGYPYLISNNTCSIYKVWQKKFISHSHGETTIEAAWFAIIQFLEWYKKQKK